MQAVPNPPIESFLDTFTRECVWGQVIVRRGTSRVGEFSLCHVVDRDTEPERLRTIPLAQLRVLAQTTPEGRFRPLKAAPNLSSGWWCCVRDPSELAMALHHLYPGSLADAWAATKPGVTPLDFAGVAARQLGRGRILEELHGPALRAVVDAGCAPEACLKRRQWTADGVSPDDVGLKSAIPCLEPCPFFLGFARTCAEIEQASTVSAELAPDDLATLAAALRHALEHPPGDLREGDIAMPLHPRRVARVLVRYPLWGLAAAPHVQNSDE